MSEIEDVGRLVRSRIFFEMVSFEILLVYACGLLFFFGWDWV